MVLTLRQDSSRAGPWQRAGRWGLPWAATRSGNPAESWLASSCELTSRWRASRAGESHCPHPHHHGHGCRGGRDHDRRNRHSWRRGLRKPRRPRRRCRRCPTRRCSCAPWLSSRVVPPSVEGREAKSSGATVPRTAPGKTSWISGAVLCEGWLTTRHGTRRGRRKLGRVGLPARSRGEAANADADSEMPT